MKKTICHIVQFVLLGLFVTACTSITSSPSEVFKNQTADQIFLSGEEAIAKGQYASAVQHFEGLDSLYPFNEHAEQADIDLIYAYYKTGDEPSAVASADRFIHLYPRSEHVDYVYYMKGLANYEQDRGWFLRYLPVDISQRDPGTARQAFDDFGTLLRLFPHSVYAPDAQKRMIYLRNLFARHDIQVATYYMQRGAYVAAANRANYVVQHYQQTPSVIDALGIMVKAYRKLGLNDRADDAYRVLEVNYPDSSVLRRVKNS